MLHLLGETARFGDTTTNVGQIYICQKERDSKTCCQVIMQLQVFWSSKIWYDETREREREAERFEIIWGMCKAAGGPPLFQTFYTAVISDG